MGENKQTAKLSLITDKSQNEEQLYSLKQAITVDNTNKLLIILHTFNNKIIRQHPRDKPIQHFTNFQTHL
jgi:hypothetical protein